MHINYISQDSTCGGIGVEDIEVEAFSTLDNSQTLTDANWIQGGCTLEILYQDGKYWVISIPSAGVLDTLRVENAAYYGELFDEDCIETRYLLWAGDYYINGQVHDFPVFDRVY